MKDPTKYTRKAVCGILSQAHPGFDRQAESDQSSHGGFRPPEFAGQHLYGPDDLLALDCQLCLRREGWPVKLAGALAIRLHEAMRAYPDAEQIALVTMESGNRFPMPSDKLDLSTGYDSGGAVREALLIDVRNLRERIADLIESAGLIVGGEDEG